MNKIPWYYKLRLTNWLMAKPWRVYPLSKRGYRYHTLYRAARANGWGIIESVRSALIFPHVHHEKEE